MAFKDKETGKWVAQWYEPNVYGVNKQNQNLFKEFSLSINGIVWKTKYA